MMRHSHNQNLSLYSNSHYTGLPINTTQGPMIQPYLERILQVTDLSLDQHRRTFAFRFDLRFPQDYSGRELENNEAIERFMASLKAKIHANRQRARAHHRRIHDSAVRYVWCREFGEQREGPHYHGVIFLNYDAFSCLGKFELGRDNLFNYLHEAWASALRLPVQQVQGLVHIPRPGTWRLRKDDPSTLHPFFERVSYLAKAYTKYYCESMHMFGSSRG